MIEVNYNNTSTPFDPICTDAAPCSLGIFMEGGVTSSTASPYTDRWMFDPTDSTGGHWQLMTEMPPRSFAAMAAVDYTAGSTTVHRAVLFGGETGFVNHTSTTHYVAPTLGDTWMFDFDALTWNRVALYGTRYTTSTGLGNLSELNARAAALTSDTTTAVLAPPPLSGASMVTRLVHTIPEIFLFGGRLKSGLYNTFDHVYKFCAGTTGEKPATSSYTLKSTGTDDASCDAYSSSNNPNSTNPTTGYVGRWIAKTAQNGGISPALVGSFMGAAAYNQSSDRIISIGGLAPVTTPAAVTSQQSVSSTVYEYTPPSKVSGTNAEKNGTWNAIATCASSATPTGRYGHTLAYDQLTDALIMVGGFDINGDLLTQTLLDQNANISYNVPEVWLGTRIANAIPNGIATNNVPAITSGTFPCYYWSQITTFSNAGPTSAKTSTPITGLGHMAGVYIPSAGYNTGYYSMFDQLCTSEGQIGSTDPSISKLLVGGAYIDINRNALGAKENLLLNITFLPLGPSNINPDRSALSTSESAVLKIHLVRTGQSADILRSVTQPRNLTYPNNAQFPQIVQDLAIISPPTGQIRQEQVLLPISIDPTIDRIHIERYSGSAILIDATVYRMGN